MKILVGFFYFLQVQMLNNVMFFILLLARLFSWIQNPVDVDGDGKFSVIDSYKYATICTHNDCKKIEHDYEIKDAKAKLALSMLKEELEEKLEF